MSEFSYFIHVCFHLSDSSNITSLTDVFLSSLFAFIGSFAKPDDMLQKSYVLNSKLRYLIVIYYRAYTGLRVVEVQVVVLMRIKMF